MPSLAREFNISLSTVHGYIEEQRKLLRAQTIDLAAQEREQALVFLDTALEEVMPHISSGDAINIQRVRRGTRAPVIMTMEAWEAKMKACEVMVKLLDRKAKLLGMDSPVKTEPPRRCHPKQRNSGRVPARPCVNGPDSTPGPRTSGETFRMNERQLACAPVDFTRRSTLPWRDVVRGQSRLCEPARSTPTTRFDRHLVDGCSFDHNLLS
jgi:hypothetical protein